MCAWLTAAASVLQLAKGANDKANTESAAKELENNRPKIGRDANADANLALVKSDLANGFSGATEQAYSDTIDRQFSTSLSGILKGGGDVNDIGSIYGTGQEGAQKIQMMRDNLRLNQIKNVLDQSNTVYEHNQVTPFQVNEFAPFQDKSAAVGVARGQAAKEQNDAFNTLISSLSSENGFGDDNPDEYDPNGRFANRYGNQGKGAWEYAKNNNMKFGQYKRKANKVGKSASQNNWL